MDTQRVKEWVLSLEKRYPVNDWSAEGVRVWPYIRCCLVRRVETRLLSEDVDNPPTSSSLKAVQRRVGTVLSKARKNLSSYKKRRAAEQAEDSPRGHASSVVCLSDGYSFVRLGERMLEKNMAPLLHALEERGLSARMLTPGYAYPHPGTTPQYFIQPGLDLVASRGILGGCPSFAEERFAGMDAFFAELKECAIPGADMDEVEFRKGLGHVFRFSRYFSRLLERFDAVLGLLTDFNGEVGMGFSLACSKRGIASVAVQHGMQPEYSLYYGHWSVVPAEGYALLPKGQWVRSEEDAHKFRAWMDGTSHDVIEGGDPFLAEWLAGTREYVKEFDRQLTAIKASEHGAVCVLVTLNGTAASEDRRIVEIIEASLTQERPLVFWLRPHPCRPEQMQRLRSLLSAKAAARCRFDFPAAMPLFALLRQADVLLTGYSSTAVDASRFGVKTVFFDSYGKQVYAGRLTEEESVFAATQAEAVELLLRSAGAGVGTDSSHAGLSREGIEHLLSLSQERVGCNA